MAADYKTSLQEALQTLVSAIKDATQLDVVTYAYDIKKGDNEAGKKTRVAQTEMLLDGDINNYVPVQEIEGELKVHNELYQLHLESLEKATVQRVNRRVTARVGTHPRQAVEGPHHLQRGLGHRLVEVAARRTDRAADGDGTCAAVLQAHNASALVETRDD